MSKMVRDLLRKHLDAVTKHLESTMQSDPAELKATIKELQGTIGGIRLASAKAAIQREIDRLQGLVASPAPVSRFTEYAPQLRAVKDGTEKLLAVMDTIPFYSTGARTPRATPKPATTKPTAKKGVVRRARS